MNIEDYRSFCLSLKGSKESMPFDDKVLVFSVGGKMFSLTNNIESFDLINVKCEPAQAVELRERFNSVIPGYHMNKKYWNSVEMDNSISDEQIKEWIKTSYNIIVSKLPMKVRKELGLE
ncbi:MAG: MmcQ/YjbR family DNA-binding protein [Bacteroidales bacterium]|nr:MmcQ/YjbR family DNA-binding protein [Bacteroidales bacterium]